MANLSDTQQTDSADLLKPGALVSWVNYSKYPQWTIREVIHGVVLDSRIVQIAWREIRSQTQSGVTRTFTQELDYEEPPFSGCFRLVPGHIAPTKEAVEFALSRLKGAKQ